MTVVILLSFLGLEGQTSSSLEEVTWPSPQLSTQDRKEISMDITLSILGLKGQTSPSLEDMPWPPPQLSTEDRKKMTMVITLSFLGLEGQTSSSLEDDGIGHGHLHNSPLRKGGR